MLVRKRGCSRVTAKLSGLHCFLFCPALCYSSAQIAVNIFFGCYLKIQQTITLLIQTVHATLPAVFPSPRDYLFFITVVNFSNTIPVPRVITQIASITLSKNTVLVTTQKLPAWPYFIAPSFFLKSSISALVQLLGISCLAKKQNYSHTMKELLCQSKHHQLYQTLQHKQFNWGGWHFVAW